MEKINGNDNRQLIEAAKERLRWYTVEASEEEFDVEEVDALVNLLSTLEPVETEEIQSDEEALMRFHAYVEMREAEDGISVADEHANKKTNNGLAVFVRTHKFIATAAAVLIMVMIAGGSLGAVNASKGNGFFYWLKKDKEGMTMITSPENLDNNTSVEYAVEYSKVEDVPREYQEYLVDVSGIEQLDGYKQQYITIQSDAKYIGIKRYFTDDTMQKNIYMGVFMYPEKVGLYSEVYLGENLEDNIEVEQNEGVLGKENPDGDMEYTLFFYKDNVRYYVEGNIDKALLEEIAKEYKNIVFY